MSADVQDAPTLDLPIHDPGELVHLWEEEPIFGRRGRIIGWRRPDDGTPCACGAEVMTSEMRSAVGEKTCPCRACVEIAKHIPGAEVEL